MSRNNGRNTQENTPPFSSDELPSLVFSTLERIQTPSDMPMEIYLDEIF